MRRPVIFGLLGYLCWGWGCPPCMADDWPQFRGPNASGLSAETSAPPIEFSPTQACAWVTPLGPGVAGPIVAAGRLFVTEMNDAGQFAVRALDAQSGNRLWTRTFETGKLPAIMPPNEHASSTPCTDGARVYVHFSTLGILALDAECGDVAWQYQLPLPSYLMGWGAANSPILYHDLLLFNMDDDLQPYLIALDKKTGQLRWKVDRTEMLAGYAVPVLCQTDGRTDVVVAGTGKLKGYDPLTGQERWTCNTLLRTMMTTPVVQNDQIFVSAQSYGDTDRVLKYALLEWRDTNQDEKLEKSELESAFHAKFAAGDVDRDGFLVGEEIDRAFQAPTNMAGGGDIIQAIRGGGHGDVTQTHVVWNLQHKVPSNLASPLAIDGKLFMVKKGGLAAAFALTTGETLFMKRRINNLGNYYASPMAVAGHVYVPAENGHVVVLRLQKEPQVLANNDLGESLIATPAIANQRLYVRTASKLFCFARPAP